MRFLLLLLVFPAVLFAAYQNCSSIKFDKSSELSKSCAQAVDLPQIRVSPDQEDNSVDNIFHFSLSQVQGPEFTDIVWRKEGAEDRQATEVDYSFANPGRYVVSASLYVPRCKGWAEVEKDIFIGCVAKIDPKHCPIHNGGCTNCNDQAISRYEAVVRAYLARDKKVCVGDVNHFAADTNCDSQNRPVGQTAAKVCEVNSYGINARDCIDAANSNPVITAGTSATTFSHTPVIRGQASVFAFAAVLAICNNRTQFMDSIVLNQIQKPLPHWNPSPPAPAYYHFKYEFVGLALGVLTRAQLENGGNLATVSKLEYNLYIDNYKRLLSQLGCEGLSDLVRTYQP